jgi:hypothetical protein
VPGCRNAWNDLGARGAYLHAQTLIEADCPMMYREGWLIDAYRARSSVTPSCKFSWNALAREGALPAVRFLVTHNCPVLERQGGALPMLIEGRYRQAAQRGPEPRRPAP